MNRSSTRIRRLYSTSKKDKFFPRKGCRMATQHKIVNGPSKFDLMLALFDPNSKPDFRKVTFSYFLSGYIDPKTGHKIVDCLERTAEVIIIEISKEDNSGESWMFKGVFNESTGNTHVRGYFHTQRRNGWIEF